MKVTATKDEWANRRSLIDRLDISQLADPLIARVWDRLDELDAINKEVQGVRRDFLNKYGMTDGAGNLQTVEDLKQELSDGEEEISDETLSDVLGDHERITLQTQAGTQDVIIEEPEAFNEAVDEALEEEVAIEVEKVPFWTAVQESDVPTTLLKRALGWMIEDPPQATHSNSEPEEAVTDAE